MASAASLPPLLAAALLVAMATVASGCTVHPNPLSLFDYTPVNSIVAVLNVTPSVIDVATTNSDGSNTGVPFKLLANSSLQLVAALERSAVLTVHCTSGASGILIIQRKDTDNNAPVWTPANYSISVSEDQSVPFSLPVNPTVTDEDSQSGQKLNFTILPGPNSDFFLLGSPDQTKMNITLVRKLNFETVQQIVLTLQVSDYNSTGQKVFEVNTTLTITVLDVDDENPAWRGCSGADTCYERQLLSNSTAGTPLLPPVRAEDGDFRINASIVYSILSQAPEAIVRVNNRTGELTLIKSLPLPRTHTVLLSAVQADNPDRRADANLVVNVVATGYAPPIFDPTRANASVSEKINVGQVVASVSAGGHLGRTITYGMENHKELFSIDASGFIRALRPLDYEVTSRYDINVSASDGASTSFFVVVLTVENDNEFNPEFSQASYEFRADARRNGLVVGGVNATDRDGDTVAYSIPDAAFARLFAIDAAGGYLRLNADAASFPLQQYRFSVSASDGSRSQTATVIVSFDSALGGTGTASVSVIAMSVLGGVFAIIIISSIVAYLLYRWKSPKQLEAAGSQLSVQNSFAFTDQYTGTSQQDNPIEGYNNYMYGDGDADDIGPFNRERDQSEIYVSDTVYHNETVDYSTLTNGSIHTFSGSSSLVGSQRTLIPGRPRQLHNGSNLQVVQVENAIDAASGSGAGRAARGGAADGGGVTVYF